MLALSGILISPPDRPPAKALAGLPSLVFRKAEIGKPRAQVGASRWSERTAGFAKAYQKKLPTVEVVSPSDGLLLFDNQYPYALKYYQWTT